MLGITVNFMPFIISKVSTIKQKIRCGKLSASVVPVPKPFLSTLPGWFWSHETCLSQLDSSTLDAWKHSALLSSLTFSCDHHGNIPWWGVKETWRRAHSLAQAILHLLASSQ